MSNESLFISSEFASGRGYALGKSISPYTLYIEGCKSVEFRGESIDISVDSSDLDRLLSEVDGIVINGHIFKKDPNSN